ncbi:MAG: hypothetical protein FWD56_06155, partial [Bacteroidales bacterium]|nr:hypothetical protein [Bacteroidales bacterium]
MGIKQIIQNRQLASVKAFKKKGKWRPGETSLRLVGLILCLEDVSELVLLKRVHRLFVKKGAKCRTCIYLKNTKLTVPEELINDNVILLNQKSINWWGMVRPGHVETFIQEPFDLVVNLSKDYFFTTTYLTSLTRATLKIGRYVWPRTAYRVVLGSE